MKKSLLVVFLFLILAPVGVISWLGFSNIKREQSMTAERYSILATKQLEEIERLLQANLESLKLELDEFESIHTLDVNELRRISRNTRIVDQLFVIDGEGAFLFPPESGELSQDERMFLETAGELELPLVLRAGGGETEPAGPGEGRWYTWFENEGIHVLYYRTTQAGYRTGVVIDRIALISRILGALPDSDLSDSDEYTNRIVLTDARGDVLYQWGLHAPGSDEAPVAVTALSQPLAAWRLHLYFDLQNGAPFFARYGALLPGVAAGVTILILLSVYFYRENAKVVAAAMQKVSFVNQVSHELRTPLTNIRLYTELIHDRLTDEKDKGPGIPQGGTETGLRAVL